MKKKKGIVLLSLSLLLTFNEKWDDVYSNQKHNDFIKDIYCRYIIINMPLLTVIKNKNLQDIFTRIYINNFLLFISFHQELLHLRCIYSFSLDLQYSTKVSWRRFFSVKSCQFFQIFVRFKMAFQWVSLF